MVRPRGGLGEASRRGPSPGARTARVPEKTVTRLSIYLRCVEELQADGLTAVSSRQLAERFGLNSAQVRKDLAYFGQFGVRGLGYYTGELKHNLERILGLKRDWQVALVGVGNLGSALLAYPGFQRRGFRLSVAFEKDPAKIARKQGRIPVHPVERIGPVLRRRGIKIAVLAIPAAGAQGVADQLVAAGVNAILNFAPTQLTVPPGVKVLNVDLAVLLKSLAFHTTRTNLPEPGRPE